MTYPHSIDDILGVVEVVGSLGSAGSGFSPLRFGALVEGFQDGFEAFDDPICLLLVRTHSLRDN